MSARNRFHVCSILLLFVVRWVTSQDAGYRWAPGEQSTYQSFQHHRNSGNLAAAAKAGERLIWLAQNYHGRDHLNTAQYLSEVAAFYTYQLGNHDKAGPLYADALRIRQKQLGPEDIYTALSTLHLADHYRELGQYSGAEPLYHRAVAIIEKVRGPSDSMVAHALNNLALLYQAMGDFDRAEQHLARSLGIKEKSLGIRDANTARAYSNLASIHFHKEDYAKAEHYNKVALKLRMLILPPGHPDLAISQCNLAEIYEKTGRLDAAEALYYNAVRIYRRQDGNLPLFAIPGIGLGKIYFERGDYANAERYFRNGLEIQERALGQDHPVSASVLEKLALIAAATSRPEESGELIRRSARAKLKELRNILTFTGERERFAYLRDARPYDALASIGAEVELANAVLTFKGIVLESFLEERRTMRAAGIPALEGEVKRLRELKSRLRNALVNNPEAPGANAKVAEWTLEKERIEKQLARSISGIGDIRRSLSVSVDRVAGRMTADMALVEFITYRNQFRKEASLGAVVIRPGPPPHFVQLGPLDQVEGAIAGFRGAIESGGGDAEVESRSRELHRLVMGNLLGHLTGVKKLVVCPDGALNFLPFSVLIDDRGRFLAEDFLVFYVASGRDLISKRLDADVEITPPVVIGNPVFALPGRTPAPGAVTEDPTLLAALRSGFGRDGGGIGLVPLPGTEREIDRVRDAIASSRPGKARVMTLSGDTATEQATRKLKSPRILHLATHGFILDDLEIGSGVTETAGFRSPMYRSGIALTGAEDTLRDWSKGRIPDASSDGILFSAEVSDLDLKGTWLVSLSACNTALGDVVSGEGILGMRRAFAKAGAQNVLMTLWEILDDPTPEFMGEFYCALANWNPPEALARVQREWLARLRKESGLASAVYTAGGFVISAQAVPQRY